jgi:DNA-binding beta-propeller fold protein YncE
VNALEGNETLVYDPATLEKRGAISHVFTAAEAPLFRGETTLFDYVYRRESTAGDPNIMAGKPVESELSHGDRFLWVPYYKRDFDLGAGSPSAVAIIDTSTEKILRVMPTGPIPKYVAASPDGRWVAVTHWGDNTLGIIDTSSGDPARFAYLPQHLVVGERMSMEALTGKDRDAECGHCLRGTVFTPDGKTLLVARMGSGGVAAFEVGTWRYLGTVTGEPKSPRHLLVTKDGQWLYLSANAAGSVSRLKMGTLMAALKRANGKTEKVAGWQTVRVGGGARTIAFSPDERLVYAASNARAEVVVVDVKRMKVVHRIRTDAYAVGLAVSPDGKQLWTTSQGHKDGGGRAIGVFSVESRR